VAGSGAEEQSREGERKEVKMKRQRRGGGRRRK
jgi:hypothetical protein